jgi:hypothetical protein
MELENIAIKPEHDGAGAMVPKDPTRDKKQEVEQQLSQLKLDKEFAGFIKDLWRKCEKLNDLEWLRVKQNMIKSRKYFDGRQYAKVNDSLEWQDFEKRPGEVNYVANVYHAHVQTALMEMSRGSTSLSFTHVSGESRRGQLIAKIAEHRWRTHKVRLMTALKMQNENLSLLLNGLAARYTFVEFKEPKHSPIKQIEKMLLEMAGVGIETMYICSVCAKKKTTSDNEAPCTNCGSTDYEPLEDVQMDMEALPAMEPEKRAYARFVNPDPIGLTFDIHATDFKDSAFLIWKQVVITDILKSQYPGLKIATGIEATELKYQYAQSTTTPNEQRLDFFMGEKDQKEVSEFCQGWFDVHLYKNVSFTKDIQLMSGETIKKGTRLGTVFPNGMYVARNGETILDIWDENKNDKWAVCPYVTRLGTLVGGGTSVAHDAQDIINDLTNLKMASIMQDAFSKEFVNAQYLEPENIPNDPTERAVVTNLPDGARIVGNAIDRLPPSPLSPDAYAMDQALQGIMQNQMGTFSATASGMPDLKAAQNTYGGMQLLRDITVGRYYPMLSVRADTLDREQAYQLILLDQKHLSQEQWDLVKGEYGAEGVKYFLEADLREELLIGVTAESFMPEMPSQRLAKTMGYAEFVAQFQVDPSSELASHVADQFGIPKSIAGIEPARAIAFKMIDAFKEQADGITSELGDIPTFNVEDPTALQIAELIIEAAQIPISGLMDNVGAIIDAMKDWWNSDEGRTSPNALKAAVIVRVRELQAEGVKEAQINQQMALAAQQPLQNVQAEQEAAMADAEEQAVIAQNMKELAVEDARLQSEDKRLQQEDKRLEQDAAERRAQREHEIKMQQMASEAERGTSTE